MHLLLPLLTVAAFATDTHGVVAETKSALVAWIASGVLASVGGAFFWWWMVEKFPTLLVDSIMYRIDLILDGKTMKGEPITDKDDRQLVIRVGMALVYWSEKKLPDKGLGPRKMQLVLNELYAWAKRFPIVGSRLAKKLKENESKIKQVITKFVKKMDTRLKAEKQKQSGK